MAFVKRKTLLILVGLSVIAVLAVAGFIWSGLYNIGADDPHMGPVYSALETLRERSIEVRANELQVPALDDPARIVQGAGNYAAMCTGCHLAPGMSETERSEKHTSELQSLMGTSYAVFCFKKKKYKVTIEHLGAIDSQTKRHLPNRHRQHHTSH